MNALSDATRPRLEVGEIIAGKFRVEHLLGRGGSGLVALATHLQLDERVALKFLPPTAAPEQLADEARACLRLKTEHVARVKDLGRHRDMPFLVMEYLEGKDLQALLDENGKLEDASEAVELVVQVCEAVAEAHRVGIVHRDIKLSNLFFVASRSSVPLVKLLDFGIAASVAETAPTKTLGTLHYMAPEALHGGAIDRRSDIWSLGVVLFELLSGWKPFGSKDVVALVVEIQHEPHISLRSLRPDLTVELEAIIDRCLEKDPDHRFQTAGELAVALLPFAPLRARANIERAVSASEESAESLADTGPVSAPSSDRRPSSIRTLESSGTGLRTTGRPRSTNPTSSSTLRASRSLRSSRSTSSTSSMNVAPPKRALNIFVWAGAACAVVALVTLLTLRRGGSDGATHSSPTASPAAPEAPRAAVAPTPIPTPADPSAAAAAPATTVAPAAATAPTGPAATSQARTVTPTPGPWPPRKAPTATPAAVTTAGTSASATPAASTTTKGLEKDPWHSNKPKLEDSPFK